MDFRKVIDQTVREIKREVNLKVLKVPEMEQKVLDATDNEPWGPHGTALAEIAQATEKFSECQMVMNVLWTRLDQTGKDWRYVYKALAVMEYLVSQGSERALDEIIEHTYQISSLRKFEYVEPNGKDMGINVRKKAESIVALLNDRDKIQEVRNKAAANRDKYFGLSSTGITYKSGTPSFTSGGYGGSNRYGSMNSSRDSDWSRDSFRRRDPHGDNKIDNPKSYPPSNVRKDKDNTYGISRASAKHNDSDNYSSVPSHSFRGPSYNNDEDFDDFDPRGTSSNSNSGTGAPSQVDLFGQNLIGDLLDAPTPVPTGASSVTNDYPLEVDLFADATFVSASPKADASPSSQTQQKEIDLFASQPATTPSVPSTIDLFGSPEPVPKPEADHPKAQQTSTPMVDPFASVPLNNFDGSDPFGSFTSHSETATTGTVQSPFNVGDTNNLNGKSEADSKTPPKNNSFQVKSGIWADSLSRGLIDLNITASKKVSLAEVGVVGGLTDGSDEKERGHSTSLYMGGMSMGGTGSGIGRTGGFASSQQSGDGLDRFFSSLGGQHNQFGNFQK